MGLFENFPYTNFHELNASWLVKKMKELEEAMATFKATESLKFADPIIWDITTQYQKSTIVLDPTGNAYLSVQPVPAGVQLNNDEYWLEIFNFTEYTRTANKNLTVHVETNTTRATAAYAVDDWLIWEDVLYKVTAAITVDDALVIGTNIIHFTVEDFCKAWVTYGNNLINQYKYDIDQSEIAYRAQLAQDIANTTASLQAQFNAAIAGTTVDSEVINARVGYDSHTYPTLGDAITSQVDNIHRGIEDLNDLDYTEVSLTPTATTNNAFPTQYGTITTSTPGYNCIEYDVSTVKAVRIKAYSVAAAVMYVFLDSSNNVLDFYRNTLGGAIRYFTKNVIVPRNAVKVLITDSTGNVNQTFGLARVSELRPVYSKVNTTGGANDNVITPRALHSEVNKMLNNHNGFTLGTELTADSSGSGFYIVDTTIPAYQPNLPKLTNQGSIYDYYTYTVTEGQTYVVQTFHAFSLKAWFVLDQEGLILDVCNDPTINQWVYGNHIVTIPKGGKTLIVNWTSVRPEQKVYETAKVFLLDSYNIKPANHYIGVIGDSLSEMVGPGIDPPNYTSKFWWEIVGDRLNSAVVCVAKRGGGYKANSGSFINQINDIRPYCDIVAVFGSGNDMSYWNASTKYGSIDDVFTDAASSSVMACMCEFFRRWRIVHPTKKIIVFSPTLWNGYDPDLNTNPRMIDYSAALKEVCEHFAVPFYDMTLGSGFTPSVETFRNTYTVDGTHLNTAGHEFVAPFFIDQISKCIL